LLNGQYGRHPYNLGYGVGLQTGYIYALENGYQYILQLDADSQHDPSDAQKVLDPVLQGQADLVIGSRFLEKSYKVPFSRRMGNKYFGFIAYLITGKKFSDCTSGYQAMNADVALLYSTKILPVDYPDSDVLIMLHRSGFRITEVPVLMKPSPSNKSMHSGIFKPLYYIIKMTLSILLVILRKRYSHGN